MSARGLALDDAAWSGAWRGRCVRDKAVLALGLLACAVALPPWPGGVVAGACALVAMLGPARVPARLVARSILAPLLFVVVGAASVLVTVSWNDGPHVGLSAATVPTALALLVRGIAGTLSVFVLATTTPMVDVFSAMRRVGLPDPLVEVASLTYRLVFVLLESTRTIAEAQAARLGYTGYRTSLRSTGSLVAAVFVRSWMRARRLEDGLAGRGYVDSLRTLDPPLRASTRFLACGLAVTTGIVALSLLVR